MIYSSELESLKKQILEKYNPKDILLFGSYAKGIIKKSSDIDLCIIIDTQNKRKTIQEMLYILDYNIDLDIVIYTEEEWMKYKDDSSTFACIINRTGVSLLGRFN